MRRSRAVVLPYSEESSGVSEDSGDSARSNGGRGRGGKGGSGERERMKKMRAKLSGIFGPFTSANKAAKEQGRKERASTIAALPVNTDGAKKTVSAPMQFPPVPRKEFEEEDPYELKEEDEVEEAEDERDEDDEREEEVEEEDEGEQTKQVEIGRVQIDVVVKKEEEGNAEAKASVPELIEENGTADAATKRSAQTDPYDDILTLVHWDPGRRNSDTVVGQEKEKWDGWEMIGDERKKKKRRGSCCLGFLARSKKGDAAESTLESHSSSGR